MGKHDMRPTSNAAIERAIDVFDSLIAAYQDQQGLNKEQAMAEVARKHRDAQLRYNAALDQQQAKRRQREQAKRPTARSMNQAKPDEAAQRAERRRMGLE